MDKKNLNSNPPENKNKNGKRGAPIGNQNAKKTDKIDPQSVFKLAEKFWAITEIAAFFNVSDRTISDCFSEIIAKGRQSGKSKLRDLQLKKAMDGNVVMLIWLGKQYLGQSDKQDISTQHRFPQIDDLSDAELEAIIANGK